MIQMDAKAWLQMEALFEVTKEDKPIIIDQSRLIAMLDGYANYRVKICSISDVGECHFRVGQTIKSAFPMNSDYEVLENDPKNSRVKLKQLNNGHAAWHPYASFRK